MKSDMHVKYLRAVRTWDYVRSAIRNKFAKIVGKKGNDSYLVQ